MATTLSETFAVRPYLDVVQQPAKRPSSMISQQQHAVARGLTHWLAGSAASLQQQQQTVAAAVTAFGCSSSGRLSANATTQTPAARSFSSSAAEGADDDASTSTSTSSPPRQWQDFFTRVGRRRVPAPGAWRERMPFKGTEARHGVKLRSQDPERFERMRLVLGYYDQPHTSHLPKPPPVRSVTVNNLQTLFYTKDIDPYYKLSLLSYRTKLANKELVAGPLAATGALMDRLEGAAAVFTPVVPAADEPAGGGGSSGGGEGEK